MSGILVPSKTAALLGQAQAIFEGKAIRRTRRIPQFLPDGTEVKTVEQVAAMMRVDSITAALYVNEQKSSVPFRLGVEAKSVLLQYGGYEVKDIVRSASGVRKYGQPIGSIIIADMTLPNLKVVDEPYEGWLTVQGDSGETYEVGLDEDATGKWVACRLPGGWDDVVIEGGKNRDDVLKKLSKHDLASASKPSTAKRKPDPKTRAVPGQGNHVKPPKAPVKIDKTGERIVDKGFDSDESWDDYLGALPDEDLKATLDYLESSKYDMDALRAARRVTKARNKPAANAPKGTFHRGPSSATSSNAGTRPTSGRGVKPRSTAGVGVPGAFNNAGARARAMTTPKTGFDPKTLKRSGMPIAGTVKPGDIVAPRWAADFPARVVKVGPVTGTGRVTIYYEDEKGNPSRQTYKINERLISFTEGGGSAAQDAIDNMNPRMRNALTPAQRQAYGKHVAAGKDPAEALRLARQVGGSPKAGSGTGNKEDDYGPIGAGDRVIVDTGPRASRNAQKINGQGGVVESVEPKHFRVRFDNGEFMSVPKTMVQKNNSGLKSPGAASAQPSRADRMAARNAQNAKDWPVGTQVTVTVHSLGGREEEVSGTVSGHSSGGVTVQTTSGHGDLSVEPSKLRKVENGWEEHLRTHMGLGTNDVVPKYQLGLRQQDQWRAMTNEQRTLANEWMRTTTASQAITRAKRGERSDAQTGTWERNAPKGKVTLKRTRKSGALEVEMDGEKYTFIPGDGWGSGWRRGWSEDGPTIGLSEATILERLNAWKKKS